MRYTLKNPAGVIVETDDTYLNRTENKDPRTPGEKYLIHIWHETVGAGYPPKAVNTLEWNLHYKDPKTGQLIASSYDALIGWDGTIYRYVDFVPWNSWAEGVSHVTVDGILYTSGGTPQLGRIALSTEIDGPNDGRPCSPAQIESAAKWRILLEETDTAAIPLDGGHDFTHAQIAPGRKTDPRGYTVQDIMAEVARLRAGQPNWAHRWGTVAPYSPTFGIPTAWRKAWEQGTMLGRAISYEYVHPENPGFVRQDFEFGCINWTPARTIVSGPVTLK